MVPALSRAIRTSWPAAENQRSQLGKADASKASTWARSVLAARITVTPVLAARSPTPGGGRYRARSVTRSRVSWLCRQPQEAKNRTAAGRSFGIPGQI